MITKQAMVYLSIRFLVFLFSMFGVNVTNVTFKLNKATVFVFKNLNTPSNFPSCLTNAIVPRHILPVCITLNLPTTLPAGWRDGTHVNTSASCLAELPCEPSAAGTSGRRTAGPGTGEKPVSLLLPPFQSHPSFLFPRPSAQFVPQGNS